ncbi:DUF3320 domain-containing protein [Paenibacillus soyae]|uniref:DUF3320 domain-containing protein n=1 Tax=Paenibacillus soyae TaxID=2969249 RepID=A0A9X2S9V3_9BACL|nr:DUF3320 domain-containing protein [Paenibacillus soyae]MCR2803978.1 DUF3320 domain-containing protein [Paenibacillus soyae]
MENVVEKKLTCEWLRLDAVNYAMQQNFVPVVHKLALRNETESDLTSITVRIISEPEFASEWTKTVDVIPAGQTVEIGAVPIGLSGSFLAGLTERLTGTLTLEATQGEELLFRESSPLTVLAYDQWAGLAVMPEMAAAFIMPNHPAVAKLIGEAAPYLEKWTGSPSFDAYQSRNPNRIRHQAAAIYAAIQAHQPTYCVAPASFEELGQRVRLPDAILSHRMGNCLDLTLLYAACLEAVGLHPLVVFTEGHAFAGIWLIQETFSESVQDDSSLLTKRLASGVHEISLVEATMLCSGSRSSYQEAEAEAVAHLAAPDQFFGFVDVKRARASAIRPLPIRIQTAGGFEIVEESQAPRVTGEAPAELTVHERPAEVAAIAVTKQKQWERKLLDLTLRNTLLSFRYTKSALPLLGTRLGELEDALAEGQEFQLLPKPSDWEQSIRSAELFRSMSKDHPLTALINEEFGHRRLRAEANERELADKAIHLYRSAKLSLEENGANTLYLALGLLKWYESPASELPRYAPIVLVPVELVRKSSRAGFILRARDEEPQINITLLEMLRQDFGSHIGGLDPLPRDEKGIDLGGIFTTIRHVIMNMPRWDIVETAILGLFSFSRFVMWNDIRSRSDDLARNKVVASLMAGRMEWEQPDTFPEAGQLDALFAPDRLLLPISADSSQITAVSAAGSDKSFVLHGPPGTGKSQTITNMIASALASGKTVLFVAEKMAALSVVQSRLESIGLGPFCLELHSNKSTKKAVLEQLRRTLETARTASPEDWRRQADRLAASRQELNGYVDSLHKPYGFGASLYEAITRYGKVKEAPAAIALDAGTVGGMTKDAYIAWTDLVRNLAVAGEAAGHPHGNAWSDAEASVYNPVMRTQVEERLATYLSALAGLQEAYRMVNALLAYPAEQPASADLERIDAAVRQLLEAPPAIAPGLLRAGDLDAAGSQVSAAIRHGRARDEAKALLLKRLASDALAYDAALALQEWKKAELQWFLPKLLKQNRIHKSLRSMALPGAALQKGETEQLLQQIIRYQTEAGALKQLEASAAPLLGAMWNHGEADWAAVEAAHSWTLALNDKLLQLYKDLPAARTARERLADLSAAAGAGAFSESNGASLAAYSKAFQAFVREEEQLSQLLKLNLEAMDGNRGEEPWFDYRARKAKGWQDHIGSLREWCSWRQVRERALAAGLAPVVSAYENGSLKHDEVLPSFERAWWKAAITFILETDPQLASFSGRLFEEKIKAFQETMEKFEQLTREEIAARLAANIPPIGTQAASSSEAGILLRAIRSGGRGLSLRKLFEQIPNLLNRLCPCVLMSPMSVAQYLDPKYAPFDLVVFDEASQLPTSEAVGAMARGRNVIVVGDPKQLPPTSFFSSAGGDESDDAVVPEDLESILDDCLALGMPQEHLLWHYRSRHESLIAFSNRHFYENKLLTFPSPSERQSSVKWHPVGGYYDRGKTKQNRAEAEAVVQEIARRLRDPELSRRSMGVVTFNSIQQTLIEDLLDDAYRREPELEQAASRLYEPIFVKNLENVQGDERDVILFSIGYGPDASGKVVLNFGPLNRDGGWRRLNVAVSRARHEMHVFSTLRADQLDVSRTRAEGVGALRSFLEYAEKGTAALGIGTGEADVRREGIETQIAEALEKEGYKVDLHVGTSGYRMDLAIVDPDRPDTYLLAVLCDGSGYKTGKTARDREVLRGQVLRQLGWTLHRVWSLDWLDNPEKELQRIMAAVKSAKERKAEAEDIRAGERESTCEGSSEEPVQESSMGANNGFNPAGSPDGEPNTPPASLETAAVQQADSMTANNRRRQPYRTASLEAVPFASEEFYSVNREPLVKEQIARVILEEGPISRPLLTRRVIQVWGMTRSGARIERHLSSLLASMKITSTEWDGIEFYWPEDAKPEGYAFYRVSEKESERRSAEELPPEEIANAVHDVLFVQGSLSAEDLVRETVKLLGYSRTGAALDKMLRSGIQEALRRGLASEEDGRVSYRAQQ